MGGSDRRSAWVSKPPVVHDESRYAPDLLPYIKIAILEVSFQVFLARPYFVNLGKRLVKSPKVCFTDTGLLCYLVGLRAREHAAVGSMGGAPMKNLVVVDLFKTCLHRSDEPAMCFWRIAAGAEVDLIVETGAGLIPIEIKASPTVRPEMASESGALLSAAPHRLNGRLLDDPQQRLELLPTVSTTLQMIVHQRHRLGRVLASQDCLNEPIQLLEALVASDLVGPRREDGAHHHLELLRRKRRGRRMITLNKPQTSDQSLQPGP